MTVPAKFDYSTGSPLPLGVHFQGTDANFSLFSRHGSRVRLLLFADPSHAQPHQVIDLDPHHHRTGDIWHVAVHGAHRGLAYAFQVDGPHEPHLGHRFDPEAVLLDPYATALVTPEHWEFSGAAVGGPGGVAAKALVTADHFDWGNDRPLKHHWSELVIYEAHVRGLSIHPSSAVRHPGTYLGVIDKIPYFKQLGITALELMPLQAFNPYEVTRYNPVTGDKLRNYWGYNTIAFQAPHAGYGTGAYPGCQVEEFKHMVKALHEADIEVLLDVVFNHTAEGDETGPILNFRGLDNSIYYLLEEDRRCYRNYSGCGNTVNCNHPVVRNYILDCLRYWVVEMHVDGFRFDLASILGRDRSGHLVPNPPLLELIAEDPILRDVKLIAEAWDAGGAYLVGRFPGERWCEWNGVYRDDLRRYWRGDSGMAGAFASRLCGSADIYEHSGKAPVNSINFVTCHDGFTLNDLVSYACKHNTANGEDNRDGSDHNFSANYGCEGPSGDHEIDAIRRRQMKNFMASLLLSRGVPMILGGDEFCRTQFGNNNAYCQDNEISWFDWRLLEENLAFFEFVRKMIAFRTRHPVLSRELFYRPEDILWFNPAGGQPDWQTDTALGCCIRAVGEQEQPLCLLFNPTAEGLCFRLPDTLRGGVWIKAVDTAVESPCDTCEFEGVSPLPDQRRLFLPDRSLVVLAEGTATAAAACA